MAQGYAFGRPAPLPSTADLIIGELTDAPVADAPATPETPEELAVEESPEFRPYDTADLDVVTDDEPTDDEDDPADD
jgi:hypothetical protein